MKSPTINSTKSVTVKKPKTKEFTKKESNTKKYNPKKQVFRTIYKKQKPNKRRTLISEYLSKCGLIDGPSWSRRAVIPCFTNSSTSLFIILKCRYDGPFLARRFVEGLRSITQNFLVIGYQDYSMIIATNQQDGPLLL